MVKENNNFTCESGQYCYSDDRSCSYFVDTLQPLNFTVNGATIDSSP